MLKALLNTVKDVEHTFERPLEGTEKTIDRYLDFLQHALRPFNGIEKTFEKSFKDLSMASKRPFTNSWKTLKRPLKVF